jgi:hypothetical protein
LENFLLISEEDGNYISMKAHEIRDHITLTMGAIIGTDAALDIAKVVVDIEQLADKVYEEQSLRTALSIDKYLWEAADNLDNTLITMSMDSTTISLILDAISKANVKLADITTYLLEDIGTISEEDADYISLECHSIRDRITIIMGHMVGTEAADQIAQIETQIEQFADSLFIDYSLYTALSIDKGLWVASKYLDLTLISLSLGCTSGAEANLLLTKGKLCDTENIVDDLKSRGYLTEGEAAQITTQIDNFISQITGLCDHVQDLVPGEGSTQTDPHSGTSESTSGVLPNTLSGSSNPTTPNTEVPSH